MKIFLIDKLIKDRTLKNGGLYSLFSFFGKGMSFVLLIILAKYIQPAEYGRLSLFSTVVTFLTYFVAFSTSGYLSVSFFKTTKDEFKKDFSTVFLLGVFSLSIFILIVLLGGEWIASQIELTKSLLWIAIVIPFTDLLYHIQQNLFRMKEKIRPYGIFNCSHAILNFVLSLLFVVTFNQGWLGRIDAQVVCSIIYAVIALGYLIKCRLFDFNIKKDRVIQILLWGIPLIPHLGAIWIRRGLDQYIINYHYSVYEVGLFSFALNVTGIIIMIGSAFNDSNSVSFYKILSNKELTSLEKRNELKHLTKSIFIIFVLATSLLILVVIALIHVVLPQYSPSIPFFLILAVYGFIQCIYFLYCNYLFYYGKTKHLMSITFGTSVLHLFLSLILTQYSLYLTACVYVFVQGIIVSLVYRKSNKLIKANLID